MNCAICETILKPVSNIEKKNTGAFPFSFSTSWNIICRFPVSRIIIAEQKTDCKTQIINLVIFLPSFSFLRLRCFILIGRFNLRGIRE